MQETKQIEEEEGHFQVISVSDKRATGVWDYIPRTLFDPSVSPAALIRRLLPRVFNRDMREVVACVGCFCFFSFGTKILRVPRAEAPVYGLFSFFQHLLALKKRSSFKE